MRDLGRGFQQWRVLGRLLPREVRERIFEPAFSDLVYGWLTAPTARRLPFSMHAAGTFLGCFAVALPRLFVRNRRLTRLSQVMIWSLVLVATAVLIAANVTQLYGEY